MVDATEETQVTVFNFRLLDSGYESASLSSFKATREAILTVFGGDPVAGTAQRVQASDLDSAGRYRRIPTGWGALD